MVLREETIERIIERLGQKGHIYCYGAGTYGRWFSNDSIGHLLWGYVSNYVDRSTEKHGKTIGAKGIEKTVISLEELLNQILSEDILIITCNDFIPILKFLNTFEALGNITCYVFSMLRGYIEDSKKFESNCPENLRLYELRLIPKKIHYCWFGKEKLNDKNLKCIESWKKYCPDYEIIRWDETNYDYSKNYFMQQAYKAKKWAYVSDYARLDIVNTFGGIYLDTDVEITREFDELLYQKSFCGFQNDREVNLGLGFGSIADSPILKRIMNKYENMSFIHNDGSLNMMPCPIIQTEVLVEMGLQLDGKYQNIQGMTVYPERVLCAKSQKTRRVHVTDKTFAIHHFDASWMNTDDVLFRKNLDDQITLYEKFLNGEIQ